MNIPSEPPCDSSESGEGGDDEAIQIGGFYDDDGNEVDDAVVRFGLMEFGQPDQPGKIIPIDRERRYRELEAKCAKLESLLAAKTSLATPTYGEERHGFRCGMHPRVIVSEHSPKVWCAVCEEPLDAVEVLREYARKERNFVYGLVHDRREAANLKKEIEELTRMRSNLKSQIRRSTKT